MSGGEAVMGERVIGCVKWGTRYGPDYVNILYRAARANMTGPFRFVCITDEGEGPDPGIDLVPFPKFRVPRETWRQSCFPKIACWRRGSSPTTTSCCRSTST